MAAVMVTWKGSLLDKQLVVLMVVMLEILKVDQKVNRTGLQSVVEWESL